MSEPTGPEEVTLLLHAWSRGEDGALDQLIPLVSKDLLLMARRHFQAERADHTLQPTALVNEVYLRLCRQRHVEWEKREQFFTFAATLMRRILIDAAKARKTDRRGRGVAPLPLDEAISVPDPIGSGVDIEALDQALERLKAIDPRQWEIVNLRYFLGLTNEEVAQHLGISVSTVKREWSLARIWLHRELSGGD